jgi:conjugative relaxase-like TrwC/TraI family protein
MVMTIAKITAGDGYTYLTRHVANGDATPDGQHDAAAYYTAQGNPPGHWTGRGAPLLGLDGQQVTEDQMRALFGQGEHPNTDAIVRAYLNTHIRHGMTERQLSEVTAAAIRHATLGRRFPAYKPLQQFDNRVQQRLTIIKEQTGRAPTQAEISKVKAGEARRQRAAVAGFDLVFSPVKSAALLWALDERPRVRDAIRQAHENALNEAFELIEEHAAYTRTGHGGIAQVKASGLIGAAFEHWDSRAGDPCLHTHVAVSAKVQGTDGQWRSLDARALYRMAVAASEAYNTAFEAHLTAALGVRFTARPGTPAGREPVREIDGIPTAMTGYFSRRRAAIEKRYSELVREYRAAHGHDPPAATTHQLARQANLDTRQGKKPPASLASKRASWRQELQQRFGRDAVTRLMAVIPDHPPPRAAPAPLSAPDLEFLAQRTVAAVALRRSTWTAWNLRAEAERVIRTEIPAITPERHRQLADTVTTLALSPRHSVWVEAPALLDEPPELRREDGESVFTEHAAGRYTSQAVLDAEQRLLNATRTPTPNSLPSTAVTGWLDAFEAITGTRLDHGQRHLVTAFACDERLLLAGIGPAGSGKTTAMRAYAHLLRQAGRRLIPLATSAAAADVLGRELSTSTDNLHKFIHEWTSGPHAAKLRAGQSVPSHLRAFALHPGDVVLVDEAGMAGTFLLDQLTQIAASQGATVRLLGDDRQLSAVESGGALRLIAAQPGTPQLSVLYRFRDPHEAAATLQLRAGDPAAVDWYANSGRIRGGSRDHMAQAAYDGWKADMLAGKITLMAAATTASVAQLSAQARADRVTAGQVEQQGTLLHDGNIAGTGDWIVTRENDRRMSVHGGRDWVKNGNAWHVEHRHPDGSLTVRSLAHSGRARLSAEYVRDHVELLYATTTHRAQGGTVDTAHPLITAGMTRENLYVLASRAREKTTLYVATHDLPFDDDHRTDQARTDPYAYAAREILLNIIATEGTALSATETITTAQEEAGSLATLIPRYLHAAHQHAEHRYADAAIQALGNRDGAALTTDPAWGAVVRRLYDAENDGWDPTRLLAVVAAQRELGTADSIAEVIAWRIDGYLTANPGPPRHDRPYEPAATARERLASTALTVLGPQAGTHAQAETAWPALLAALRRAEDAGYDPAQLLDSVASMRELRSARSISEVLAWRIGHHLATHAPGAHDEPQPTPASVPPAASPLLPWLTIPSAHPAASTTAELTRWLDDAARLISARIDQLADTAIRHRPPWMTPLGQPPQDPEAERHWRARIAVIAAYRDQHKITTSDLRQVLGPFAEPSHAGHKAYWHAAESIIAARQLSGLDPAPETTSPDNRARAHLAADIYRSLPEAERTAISNEMSVRLGPLWLGNPAGPDENAATQPAHTATLTSALAKRGHLTAIAPAASPQITDKPLEADLARRGPTPDPRGERSWTPAKGSGQLLPPRLRPTPTATRVPQHRGG